MAPLMSKLLTPYFCWKRSRRFLKLLWLDILKKNYKIYMYSFILLMLLVSNALLLLLHWWWHITRGVLLLLIVTALETPTLSLLTECLIRRQHTSTLALPLCPNLLGQETTSTRWHKQFLLWLLFCLLLPPRRRGRSIFKSVGRYWSNNDLIE